MSIPKACVYHKDNSPCFFCESRCIGCHSKCDKYKAYTDKIKQAKDDVMERNKGRRMIEHYMMAKHYSIELFELKQKRRKK